MAIQERFAANMHAARDAHGWTLNEFSRRCKEAGLAAFHPSTISRIEQGKRQVRLDEAPAIASVFGLTVEQLMKPAEDFALLTRFSVALDRYYEAVIKIREAAAVLDDVKAAVPEIRRAAWDLTAEQDRELSTMLEAGMNDIAYHVPVPSRTPSATPPADAQG